VSIPHTTTGTAVRIDCTRPAVVVVSPPSGGLYNVLPTANLVLHDDVGLNRGYYQIDACTGAWTELWPYNSGHADTAVAWTVPSVAKGTHTVYFKAADDVGNVNGDSCSSSWSFTYRTPVISLEPSRPLIRCGDLDTVWISANEDMVDIKGAYLRIGYDAGLVTPLTVIAGAALVPPSNYVFYSNIYADSVVINLAALVGHFDGPGRMLGLVVQGISETASTALTVANSVLRDPSNVSIPHTTTGTAVRIDCTRPTVVVVSPPSGGLYTVLPTVNLALHDGVGLNRGYYQIDACTGAWTELWSYNSGQADTAVAWTVPSVPMGQHTIYFKATDDVGYTSADTCSTAWVFTYRTYLCGDANGDGKINIADAVYIVTYVFKGGPAPNPLESGDANCDGKINVGDAVYLVNYIFRGGPEPCCP
jgi:hypothetical protein